MKDFTYNERLKMLLSIDYDVEKNKDVAMDANALFVSLDTPIYRIYDYDRFLNLLSHKKNVLVRPSYWEDPYENMLYNNVKYYKEDENGKKIAIDVSSVRDRWYGQCWTDRQEECDGLWRVYSNNRTKRCVRVKSTVKKMFDYLFDTKKDGAILSYFAGKVQYNQNINKILKSFASALGSDTTNLLSVYTLLIKRKEFSYESEVRFLYNELNSSARNIVYEYEIDPNKVFEEVILDPWCEDRLVPNYKDEIFLHGYNGPVLKSALYDAKKIIIKL